MERTDTPAVFTHEAMFYRSEQQYLETVLPFILGGISQGDPVLVAVPTGNLTLLRDALGDVADRVEMSDMTEVGRNPPNTFAMFAAAIAKAPREQRVWAVAEPVWPGRTPDEYPACVQNEALFNTAFTGNSLATLCPYDAAGLPADVLADARRTHPLIRQANSVGRSADYAWQQAWSDYNQPLTADPDAVSVTVTALADLAGARAFAADYARSAGLAPARIGDLHLILTELATNSLKYTGTGCRVALWRQDGRLVCEVRDGGRFDDMLAGRIPAPDDANHGRGLLLVNALADLMRMHTGDVGTTIQAFLPLEPAEEFTE